MNKKSQNIFVKDAIVRSMEEDDLVEVSRIEFETFKEPWSYEALKFELKQNSFCHSFALEKDYKLIGYAFLHIHEPYSHLVNIAIDKDSRGIGFGEFFLKEIIKKARKFGSDSIILEVRESNTPAINLYLKLGFKILKEQKKYYHDGEDALIMQLLMKNND